MIMHFGQFVDHDMDQAPVEAGAFDQFIYPSELLRSQQTTQFFQLYLLIL